MMQLKTQVAVSAGEEKSLRQKQSECAAQVAEWQSKAELAAGRKDEHIALGAKERLAKAQHEAASAEEQLIFQSGQLQKLRSAMEKLDRKYREAQTLLRTMEGPPKRTQKAVEPIPGTQVRGSVSDQNEVEKIISDLKEKVSNE
jgi:phage shock protein A